MKSRQCVARLDICPEHALGIWICGCSLFYRRELLISKSADFEALSTIEIHANIFPGWSKVNLATLQGDCLQINCFESYSQNNPVVVTYQNNLRRSRRFSWCRNKMLQFNYNIMLISWLLRIFCSRLLRQSGWTTQMLLNVKVGLCFDHLNFVILLVTLVTLINVLT